MLNATFRPIANWPGKFTPSYSRKTSPFRAKYSDTLDLLEAELGKLRAKDIIIQLALGLADIRNDGWPRSSARPAHPGVIVSFVGTQGPISMPCDRHTTWEANLRAIALSLEALRTVDRYGVTRNGEQYKGWTQLPPPAPPKTAMELHSAVAILSNPTQYTPSEILTSPEKANAAYRTAARRAHPDAGGSTAMMAQLNEAIDVIRKYQEGRRG